MNCCCLLGVPRGQMNCCCLLGVPRGQMNCCCLLGVPRGQMNCCCLLGVPRGQMNCCCLLGVPRGQMNCCCLLGVPRGQMNCCCLLGVPRGQMNCCCLLGVPRGQMNCCCLLGVPRGQMNCCCLLGVPRGQMNCCCLLGVPRGQMNCCCLLGVPRGSIPPQFDEDDEHFTDLIANVSKGLGEDAMAEVYFYLRQMMSASGGKFLGESCFPVTFTTIDAFFVPLIDMNLISSQDVDLLIAVLLGVGKKDLIPLVESYCSKATICHSVFKLIKDPIDFFSLRLDVDPDVCVDLDLQTVSLVKRDICVHLGVEKTPYLLQFIGWRRVPLIVQFQVHFSLVDRLLELARDPSCPLDKYVRMDMDVRGSIFNFHFSNHRAPQQQQQATD